MTLWLVELELVEALNANTSTNSITFIASMRLVTNYFTFRTQHMVHTFGAIYIATIVTSRKEEQEYKYNCTTQLDVGKQKEYIRTNT
jgi:hypothetical protein